MDELAARERLLSDYSVSRETLVRLDEFIQFLRNQNDQQNLVSRGTLDHVWARHILDSAQLLRFAPSSEASWLDLGSGAGFPGLIVALLHDGPVTLVEERKKRVEFLQSAAEILGLGAKVSILPVKVERIEPSHFDVISARAFAPLDRLLDLSHWFSTAKTRFILPKGRNASSELEAALASWQGDFRLERSLTAEDAHIIVAERVSRVGKSRKPKRKGAP